jgi:hypothetical protein
MEHDLEQEAWDAYESQARLLEELELAYDELGRPATTEGGATGRAIVPHPLIREIREQSKHVDSLRTALRKKHRGPQPSAVVTPLRAKRITRKAS